MEEKLKRSRKLREWYPNAMYHITSRCNRRNDIFRDGEHYKVYVKLNHSFFAIIPVIW